MSLPSTAWRSIANSLIVSYLERLWRAGIRGYQLVFNVPDEPIAEVVASYRRMLDQLVTGGGLDRGDMDDIRGALGGAFTRGHFARAV